MEGGIWVKQACGWVGLEGWTCTWSAAGGKEGKFQEGGGEQGSQVLINEEGG